MDTEILASSLHSLQRPLVVSFRRIPKEPNSSSFTSESSSNFNHDYSEYCSIQHLPQHQSRKINDVSLKRFPRTICMQNYNKSCYDYTNEKESYSSISFDEKNSDNFYNLNKVTSPSIHSEQRDECMILESRKRIRRLDEKHIKLRTRKKFEELKLTIRKQENKEMGKCFSEENFMHNSTNFKAIYSNTSHHKITEKSKNSHYKIYKSPYESPELSTNYKKLEDNLRLILEDLVLYPSLDSKNRYQPTKTVCRCRSLPLLADKKTLPALMEESGPNNNKNLYKKDLSINSQTHTENGSASTGSCDSLLKIVAEESILDTSLTATLKELHPLNILIQESEVTFG